MQSDFLSTFFTLLTVYHTKKLTFNVQAKDSFCKHCRKKEKMLVACFCRGERRKYAGKKSRLNRGSNSKPPGHESDTLTTEPPGRGFQIGQVYISVL